MCISCTSYSTGLCIAFVYISRSLLPLAAATHDNLQRSTLGRRRNTGPKDERFATPILLPTSYKVLDTDDNPGSLNGRGQHAGCSLDALLDFLEYGHALHRPRKLILQTRTPNSSNTLGGMRASHNALFGAYASPWREYPSQFRHVGAPAYRAVQSEARP